MTENRWDLSLLYPTFNAEFEKDLSAAAQKAEELSAQAGRLNLQQLFDGYNLLADLSSPADYLELVQMTDTEDAGAKRHAQAAAGLRRAQAQLKSAFMRKAAGAPHDMPLWEKHPQYREDCVSISAHLLPENLESTVRMMQQNGSHAWQSLRNSLDAAAGADFALEEGEPPRPWSLSALRNLMFHPAADVRRRAFEAEKGCYQQYQRPMAACLNGVKGEGIALAPLRGFDSVLAQMLHENRMDSLTLDAMLKALKKHLPTFRAYLKKKAALLGCGNGLAYCDLLAPVYRDAPQYSFEQARDLLIGVFQDFSPEMGRHFERAFRERWIDAEPRPGKIGGALCCDLPGKGQSRILVNFSGSFSNVRSIAHEMGHAFHGQHTIGVPAIFRDAPTPVCESAAIFNETVLQQAVSDNAALLEVGLAEAAQTIVDIYSRYLFEDAVFDIRKNRPLDAGELCRLMEEAQAEAYGDGLDPNGRHPYMWMCKPHYYIPDYHYYNFPYIFGLLFAKGLYSVYRRQPQQFMPRYRDFLRQSCAGSVYQMALRMDIDLHSGDFWEQAFSTLEDEYACFL